ncbi:histidinol phosphate phosphatase domain-containing protein [Sporosarcina sp. CAU 1771]
MLVDYHVHLEEGPYTFSWMQRTIQALDAFQKDSQRGVATRNRAFKQVENLDERMQRGCFSEEWLNLYLRKAKEIGLKEVGIVDHLYRFKETASYFEKYMNIDEDDVIGTEQRAWLTIVMTEDMGAFTEFITSQKEVWAKEGIQLRLGIEADYFPGGEEELSKLLEGYEWDYVIGSVHFVKGWGFDNPKMVDVYSEWDVKELYTHFFESVEKMIRSGLFDFVAHLDNLKVFNIRVDDEAFNHYWYERIGQALVDTNTATEVNAGLYYRYPVKEMCPGPEFLSILVEKGVQFTTSSDSHYPDDLGNYTAQNGELLKKIGLTHIATFQNRERIMKKL